MEEQQENTNYVHVEGQVDSKVATTITSTEAPKTSTVKESNTVKFPKHSQSEKKSKSQMILNKLFNLDNDLQETKRKMSIVAAYTQQSNKVASDTINDAINALNILYNQVFKDCKILEEVDIPDNEAENYHPIIG